VHQHAQALKLFLKRTDDLVFPVKILKPSLKSNMPQLSGRMMAYHVQGHGFHPQHHRKKKGKRKNGMAKYNVHQGYQWG
jgi:hypothetical protein